jgi:nucleotide-binding universal stress UspA family protein
VLAGADRYARGFGSPLSVIHAAAEHSDSIERFFEAFSRLHLEDDTGILWSESDTPANAILSAIERGGIDLLLAGALEREGEHRNFVGGVARELLQRVPCDLLLLPKPREQPEPCRRVVVEVDIKRPSPLVFLNRSCELASRLGAKEMVFVAIVTPFDEMRAEGGPFDEKRLAEIVDEASGFEGDVDIHLLRSTTGFAMCDFLQESGAGLFISGSRRKEGARRLPPRLDWLLQVIPTNILLIGLDA